MIFPGPDSQVPDTLGLSASSVRWNDRKRIDSRDVTVSGRLRFMASRALLRAGGTP